MILSILKRLGGSSAALRLMRDRSGNFGILTAIALPILIAAAGAAVDLANAMQSRNQMNSIADAASLAAAQALTDKTVTIAQATQIATDYANAQITALGLSANSFKISVVITPTVTSSLAIQNTVAVKLYGKMDTSLMRAVGINSMDIASASTSTSSTGQQNSLSMYLVLDRSGSMQASVTGTKNTAYSKCTYYYMNAAQTAMYSVSNYSPCMYQRIEVLQNAVSSLLQTLEKTDPTHTLVRTGADAYSSSAYTQQKLDWGESGVSTYVAAMSPGGGTSSTDAFKAGVDAMVDPMENTYHLNKNGLVPKKFMILMTDGENNYSSDNTATITQCKRAKDANITVYTVGFLLSSATAKSFLLSCASNASTYYDATDGASLSAAFANIAQQTSGSLPLVTN